MGNQKLKWTADEEQALLAGIAKHGAGKWKNILRDSDFSDRLSSRSNIDLKDKWRNLSVAPGTQGSNNKARPAKVKEELVTQPPVEIDEKTTPPPIVNPIIPPAPPLVRINPSDLIPNQNCKSVVDPKNAPRYDGMIFEALSALADENGSDVSSIFHFIEPRHEVPLKFRRTLTSRLSRLVAQSKLEKVQNFYKIPDPSVIRTTPAPKPKETHMKSRQSNHQALQMIEEAAITAACKVVEAENIIDISKVAGEEFEKMTKLAEGAEHLMVIANEMHERCCRGEVVLLA